MCRNSHKKAVPSARPTTERTTLSKRRLEFPTDALVAYRHLFVGLVCGAFCGYGPRRGMQVLPSGQLLIRN
jgi:hypothetical protein